MNVKETITKAIDNTVDAVSEGKHRGEAAAEQAKRDLAGDTMTPGDKVSSVANQAKNTVQADLDAAKQAARKNT
jgi:hypothetical protein